MMYKMVLRIVLIILCVIPSSLVAKELNQFSQIAIQHAGRKKPLTVFAREVLLSLSGKEAIMTVEGEKIGSTDFVLSVWFHPEGWERQPVILVDNPLLRKAIGLDPHKKLYSFEQLKENSLFRDFALRHLHRNAAEGSDLKPEEKEAMAVSSRMKLFEELYSGEIFTVIPDASDPTKKWVTVEKASLYYPQGLSEALITLFDSMKRFYLQGDLKQAQQEASLFSKQVRDYAPRIYPSADALLFEHTYTLLHPWKWSLLCYIIASVVFLLTSGWQKELGYRIGWGFTVFGFLFHVYGFICRIFIAGRPPVSNMYESVVWVSFGVLLFALIFEAIYHSRFFLKAATPFAAVCMLLVESQPLIFDPTIQPLVPVLRNNFWLTIHVLTITLSYAAFALALGLSHIYLWHSVRRPGLEGFQKGVLAKYIYRSLQIGVFLLASGTILGGVWANYSWGRFWDWDPKETWALITLLCYLAVLHGRIAHWWGEFGLAVGSICCFISVLMAWYGVNFVLGKGLHSYGFGSGGLGYVILYVLAELGFVFYCLVKHRLRKKEELNPPPSPIQV
ncbi:cytochrome c biogenesis protein [Candidatus Methylacidiphilum infernorum]|uniref:ABC-type transport system involved in cytochrome c biogenesis, permease component n=1 Tax=Methylacidiphilum infernorum (isolate V4) TaxID=481448 RepID=B3E106_METI4|nr:cytochrome c biogenesis protein CcsA [Candidatus Methylacidiphilum infernorum]ACD84483.1 ABC-type transport system involved in cytochrome c biogenesis, permease component [Methylacidiphilum infernorum V4]